jgi:uncharacterized protein (TIGR02001 family)
MKSNFSNFSNFINFLTLATLAVPGLVLAEESPLNANITLTSDYIFRGVTQTNDGAAIQGGFDYAHDSGVYAGVWASNVSALNGDTSHSLEVDTYLGYGGSITEDVSYDVGFLRYGYPGNSASSDSDTNELYASVSYRWISAKYSTSTTDLFGISDSKGSVYMELNGSYDIEESGVSVGVHYGNQTVANNSTEDYADYNLSVSKDFSGYSVGVMFSKTDITGDKSQSVVSVSHSM